MGNNLTTSIHAFDEMIGEIQPGDVIVIAGRPGMGKTTLALQILAKNCLDKNCVYLSSTNNATMCFTNIACILGNLNRYSNEKEVWESVYKYIYSQVSTYEKAIYTLNGVEKADLPLWLQTEEEEE